LSVLALLGSASSPAAVYTAYLQVAWPSIYASYLSCWLQSCRWRLAVHVLGYIEIGTVLARTFPAEGCTPHSVAIAIGNAIADNAM
jgi:hypothetical protein